MDFVFSQPWKSEDTSGEMHSLKSNSSTYECKSNATLQNILPVYA